MTGTTSITTTAAAETIPAPGTTTAAAEAIPAPRTTTAAAEAIPAPRTTTVTQPDVREVTDDGDHDRFAHYTRRADANRAYVEGTPVRALCGKVWVPSRDPSRYPVCPECTKIRERLHRRAFN